MTTKTNKRLKLKLELLLQLGDTLNNPLYLIGKQPPLTNQQKSKLIGLCERSIGRYTREIELDNGRRTQ